MIVAHQQKDGSFVVIMDPVERIAISRLSDSYSLSNESMLVGCLNKGIDVFSKIVKDTGHTVPDIIDGEETG